MARIRLRIIGISNSQSQTGAFALILGEMASNKRIPIIIGAYEAQAIALEMESMKPSRPLTHDLMVNMMKAFGINLKEIYINKFHEGIFYSVLICEKDGDILEIDSRTSDAVALAVRFKAPIFCDKEIIDKTAIVIDNEPEAEEQEPLQGDVPESDREQDWDSFSLSELEMLLQQAVEEEDFEQASIIRDIINKRKGEK